MRLGSHALVALTIARLAHAQPAPPERFGAADMLEIRTLAGGQPLALAPDGARVAYVLTDTTDEANVLAFRGSGHVQVLALQAGAAPLALTSGGTRSSYPAWSPDGTRLAFVREEPGGGRLAVWDPRSGATRLLGEGFGGRAELAPQWDASGESIVYAQPLAPEPPAAPARVRVVESSDARIPGDQFFVNTRRAGLSVVDVRSGRSRPLLPAPVVLRSFRLSPDGRNLIYTAPAPETLGVVGRERNETFLVPLASGTPRKLAPEAGAGPLSWGPDGRALLYAQKGRFMLWPLEGGETRPLLPDGAPAVTQPVWAPGGARFAALVPDPAISDPELEKPLPGMYTIARPYMDLYLVSPADGDARNLTAGIADQVSHPVWSPDATALYFKATDNRSYDETLYRYDLASATLTALSSGRRSFDDLQASRGRIVFTAEDAAHPPDLYSLEAGAAEPRRLTTLNPQLERFRFSVPEIFDFWNADGERLSALLYKPVGADPTQPLPVITYVYEKMTPQVHRFSAQNQIFLSHGFAMLLPNVKVKTGATATSFVKCVVPAVNAVRAMGFSNGRFGLWGGSFGGYATSYLITQTDIFAAAVSRATPPELFRNWASGRDRDSRNIETGQARMGGGPFDYPERYLSQSAFFQLDKVNTPVLIVHGERDQTILFGEGEMMFYALRQLNKPASFVIYTYGDHSPTRGSRPDTLDFYARLLDWFDRYLKREPVAPLAH